VLILSEIHTLCIPINPGNKTDNLTAIIVTVMAASLLLCFVGTGVAVKVYISQKRKRKAATNNKGYVSV